jgi:regulator of protease activity HflC (stomatin/prohibitin superfamily)
MQFGLIVLVVVLAYLINSVKILKEYERGVIFRLGRVLPRPKGPGLIFVFVPIDTMVRVSLRVVVLDVPEQDIITRDNVSAKVNAVVYFRVMDASKAILEVENFMYATSQLAQTTLRSVMGQVTLDEILSAREKISGQLQEILDRMTDPWGIKVSNVEIKHVYLPEDMQRAMAREAEAERERRAKVISAEGEYQAAEKLVMAAKMMGEHPISVQLRYLETLIKVASDQNTTTLFPIPIDLFKVFFDKEKK